MTPNIRILTMVWGDKYLDWMGRGLCRSLSWAENKHSLKDARWHIFSDLENTQRIYEMATTVLPFHQIELHEIPTHNGQRKLLEAMLRVQRACLLEKIPMLTAPPDTIFSEGSIKAMMDWSYLDTCVTVSHPRAIPDLLKHISPEPMKNEDLVSLAMKYPHWCWEKSNIKLDVNATFRGGISWDEIAPGIYHVIHHLPTPYLTRFIDDDRKFFSKAYKGVEPQYGMWDHEWPADQVVSKERQRHIGSSDVAFIIELTDEWNNHPLISLKNIDFPTAYCREEYHNKMNRQYISVFRGKSV